MPADLEQHLVGARRAVGVEALDLAADHQLDQLVGRGRRRDPGGRRAAVAEHRDPVADPADLVEAVGDVDDADALGGEPADDLEQGLDLALVEDRRGLVHDQQADVVGERPGDRDHLLGGRAQGADASARIDRPVAEALEQRRRLVGASARGRGTARDAARGRGRCSGRRSGPRPGRAPGRSSRRRGRGSPAGSPSGSGSPRDEDLARGRLDRAGDALDQRRLAGAVGAEQAVDLALEHLEVDALQRLARPGTP